MRLLLLLVCVWQAQSKATLEKGECHNPLLAANGGSLRFKLKSSTEEKGDTGPPEEIDISELQTEIEDHISKLIHTELAAQNIIKCNNTDLGTLRSASSCTEIYNTDNTCRSGFYWVEGEQEGGAHLMYCNMEDVLCGSVGGWTQLANINVSKNSSHCPYPLTKVSDPGNFCKHSSENGCDSITFNTYNISYSEVCGRVQAHQFGTPDAFRGWILYQRTIDELYLDGISITHGSPRQHIWSLPVGISSTSDPFQSTCPCRMESVLHQRPDYVEENYYCDSGNLETTWSLILYDDKWLYDGTGCPSDSLCCDPPLLPWFHRELNATRNDIEFRVCLDEDLDTENIYIKTVDLYIR